MAEILIKFLDKTRPGVIFSEAELTINDDIELNEEPVETILTNMQFQCWQLLGVPAVSVLVDLEGEETEGILMMGSNSALLITELLFMRIDNQLNVTDLVSEDYNRIKYPPALEV